MVLIVETLNELIVSIIDHSKVVLLLLFKPSLLIRMAKYCCQAYQRKWCYIAIVFYYLLFCIQWLKLTLDIKRFEYLEMLLLFSILLDLIFDYWFQRDEGDVELCSVYVPTNHLYIGDVFLVNSEEIIRPNLSIRECIGMISLFCTSTMDSDYVFMFIVVRPCIPYI